MLGSLPVIVHERVLHIFEHVFPSEDAPRRAIETARRYANDKATLEELKAAREKAEYVEIHIPSEIPRAWGGYVDAVSDAAHAAGGTAIYMEGMDKICGLVTAIASYAVRAVKVAGGDYLASAEAHWQACRLLDILEG